MFGAADREFAATVLTVVTLSLTGMHRESMKHTAPTPFSEDQFHSSNKTHCWIEPMLPRLIPEQCQTFGAMFLLTVDIVAFHRWRTHIDLTTRTVITLEAR